MDNGNAIGLEATKAQIIADALNAEDDGFSYVVVSDGVVAYIEVRDEDGIIVGRL